MKKAILAGTLLAGILLTYSFVSKEGEFQKYHSDNSSETAFSANPPAARTGAPGESNCTACHSGTAQSAAGIVDFDFDGTSYLPSQTYDISISIASGTKNGFQLTILDDSDNAAGTFTAGTGSGTTESGGRNYIRHTSSTGVTSWDFQWTAPDSDMGNLTAYYSFAETNANGGSSGDVIYLGQNVIEVDATAGELNEYQEIDQAYKVYFNEMTQNLNVQYALFSDAAIVLQLIDLNGKLIQEVNIGQQFSGEHTEEIMVPSEINSGLYFVSMFQDNLVFNKKVYIP